MKAQDVCLLYLVWEHDSPSRVEDHDHRLVSRHLDVMCDLQLVGREVGRSEADGTAYVAIEVEVALSGTERPAEPEVNVKAGIDDLSAMVAEAPHLSKALESHFGERFADLLWKGKHEARDTGAG